MTDTWAWWGARQFRYNVGIVAAGIAAFLALVAVIVLVPILRGEPVALVHPFAAIPLGIGYLAAIGLANLCYFAGPLLETLVKPENPPQYRAWAYRLGFWGSVALPFALPVVTVLALLIWSDYPRD